MTVAAEREIGVDDTLDRAGDGVAIDACAETLAEAGVGAGLAAQSNLVIFNPPLFEPEDPYRADMVVAAGVDAARDLDAQFADLALAIGVGEAFADCFGDGDRARGGELAIVHARAGDDVGDQPSVGGFEPGDDERRMDRRDVVEADVWQDDILTWVMRSSSSE